MDSDTDFVGILLGGDLFVSIFEKGDVDAGITLTGCSAREDRDVEGRERAELVMREDGI